MTKHKKKLLQQLLYYVHAICVFIIKTIENFDFFLLFMLFNTRNYRSSWIKCIYMSITHTRNALVQQHIIKRVVREKKLRFFLFTENVFCIQSNPALLQLIILKVFCFTKLYHKYRTYHVHFPKVCSVSCVTLKLNTSNW